MDYDIQKIRETQTLLLNQTESDFKRFLFDKISWEERMIGIVGPRGVGKTTLILQYLKEKRAEEIEALYLVADNVLFRTGDLVELARDFYLNYGGRLLCIDEIHRFPNWNQELKNIYDLFPDMKVIFSGSSSLSLVKGKYDLSRRAVVYSLPGLSFREYLSFMGHMDEESISAEELFRDYRKISDRLSKNNQLLKYFREYLGKGYYPFFKESSDKTAYFYKIQNTIDKSIYEDIAGFYNLKTPNLITFKQILQFLVTINPGEVNINKLAGSLDRNFATIAEYLEILKESNLIRYLISNKSGHAMIRRAEKIYPDNPDLVLALSKYLGKEVSEGMLRELFVLNQLQNSGVKPFFASKGDFQLDGKVIEVGGKNKDKHQISGVADSYLALDNILTAEKGKIPLYLFGFLY